MTDTSPTFLKPGRHAAEFSLDGEQFIVKYVIFERFNLTAKTSRPFVNEWIVYDNGFDHVPPPKASIVWEGYCASERREGRPLPI